jgi:hypothetical protein
MKPNSTTQVIKYGLNPLVLTRDLFLLVHYWRTGVCYFELPRDGGTRRQMGIA